MANYLPAPQLAGSKKQSAISRKETAMKYGDWTMGQTEALINKLGGLGAALDILRGVVIKVVISYLTITHKDTVNYDRSIVDSVKAGAYDWSNGDITDVNFPSEEKGTQEVEFGLFHFNRPVSSEDAKAGIKEEGFRPATMKEMLACGEKHPEEQRKFPIIALGSVVALSGCRFVGCLGRDGSKRDVDLECYDGDWFGSCRFLVVRI